MTVIEELKALRHENAELRKKLDFYERRMPPNPHMTPGEEKFFRECEARLMERARLAREKLGSK